MSYQDKLNTITVEYFKKFFDEHTHKILTEMLILNESTIRNTQDTVFASDTELYTENYGKLNEPDNSCLCEKFGCDYKYKFDDQSNYLRKAILNIFRQFTKQFVNKNEYIIAVNVISFNFDNCGRDYKTQYRFEYTSNYGSICELTTGMVESHLVNEFALQQYCNENIKHVPITYGHHLLPNDYIDIIQSFCNYDKNNYPVTKQIRRVYGDELSISVYLCSTRTIINTYEKYMMARYNDYVTNKKLIDEIQRIKMENDVIKKDLQCLKDKKCL